MSGAWEVGVAVRYDIERERVVSIMCSMHLISRHLSPTFVDPSFVPDLLLRITEERNDI